MSRRNLLLVVWVLLVCVWCGWVSGFHRDSVAAELTWLVSLAAVAVVDIFFWAGRKSMRWGWRLEPVVEPWPRPGRGGGGPAVLGTSPWLGLFIVAVAWDVLALDTPPGRYHLTISALSQAYRPLNALLLLAWLGAGVGYGATRARAPVPAPRPSPAPDPARDTRPAAVVASVTATVGRHPVVTGSVLPGLLLPQVPAVGVAFWVAVPVVAIAIDQVARRSGGRIANGEEFLRFISTATTAQVLLVVAWGFAGYHLFAR